MSKTESTEAISDSEWAARINAAAKDLAVVMNQAANTGLMIEIKMKPHYSQSDTRRVYKLGEFRPIVDISRTIYL